MGELNIVSVEMLGLIPLFPLLGALFAYIVGGTNKDLSGWIATGASGLSFLVVVISFIDLPENTAFEHNVFNWISSGIITIDFLFRFDSLTAVMCLVVTGVGTLIHLYSVGYMAEDESRPRFFAYLNLFMFTMLLLVLGGNLLVLFVGWEGVGLCSYLLIGFWHKNIAFAGAGRKAFVVNRIGDAGFLIAMFLLLQHFGTLDFIELSSHELMVVGAAVPFSLIAICFFVGATGKSAQIPLFVWLPDAMAGPTPVSALIHAATMVTAGVYLLARLNFLFTLAPVVLFIVCVIALITAVMAATTALTQNDIKKVLAYSTVSQLGFMFLAAGSGAYWVAVFHLVTHAFFKACLFLGAGSVIQGCHHEQDMREMGGLAKLMPWTCATYGISTLAIAGIAPFAAYYSKHAILSALSNSADTVPYHYFETFASGFVLVTTFTAFLTAFYMTRSFAMTFLGEYRGHAHPHESPWTMVLPLVVLAFLGFVGGYLLSGSFSLQEYLANAIPVGHAHAHESFIASLMHSWVGILGVVLGLLLYTKLSVVPKFVFKTAKPLSILFSNKYYFDEIYQVLVVNPLELLAKVLFKGADQRFIDGTVNGTAAVVDASGELIKQSQTGQTRHYALFMFAGSVLMIIFYIVL